MMQQKGGFIIPLLLGTVCLLGLCFGILVKTTILWDRLSRMYVQQITSQKMAEKIVWHGVKKITESPSIAAGDYELSPTHHLTINFQKDSNIWHLASRVHDGAQSICIDVSLDTNEAGVLRVLSWQESAW